MNSAIRVLSVTLQDTTTGDQIEWRALTPGGGITVDQLAEFIKRLAGSAS